MQTREQPAPWDRVAREGGDLKSFEIAPAEWVRTKVAEARQLFVETVEEPIEREHASALRRKGLEGRTIWTESGPATIIRQRYYYAAVACQGGRRRSTSCESTSCRDGAGSSATAR